MSWVKNCVSVEAVPSMTGINFMINSTNVFFPIVSLSINDNNKF